MIAVSGCSSASWSLRKVGLDDSGPLSALLLLGAMTGAFAGGMLLKGKSGWCSTICPLLPVQRIYGQTPFALVGQHALPAVRRLRQELLRLQPARRLPGRPQRRRRLLERLPQVLRRRLPGPDRGLLRDRRGRDVGLGGWLLYMAVSIALVRARCDVRKVSAHTITSLVRRGRVLALLLVRRARSCPRR